MTLLNELIKAGATPNRAKEYAEVVEQLHSLFLTCDPNNIAIFKNVEKWVNVSAEMQKTRNPFDVPIKNFNITEDKTPVISFIVSEKDNPEIINWLETDEGFAIPEISFYLYENNPIAIHTDILYEVYEEWVNTKSKGYNATCWLYNLVQNKYPNYEGLILLWIAGI